MSNIKRVLGRYPKRCLVCLKEKVKPYEIWYYYQLDRECIFVDYSGFGDYRLQNPTADLFRGLR